MIKKITLGEYQDIVAEMESLKDKSESDFVFYKALINKKATKSNTTNNEIIKKNKILIDEIENAKKELVVAFKMDGVEYGFIPDLENITFGEVADLDLYIDLVEDHHKAMSVLYRPITNHKKNKYNIVSYQGSGGFAEIMKDMPLAYYLSAIGFFERLGEDLQNAFPSYLETTQVATT